MKKFDCLKEFDGSTITLQGGTLIWYISKPKMTVIWDGTQYIIGIFYKGVHINFNVKHCSEVKEIIDSFINKEHEKERLRFYKLEWWCCHDA